MEQTDQEQLLKQLSRRIKWLNVWLGLMSVFALIMLGVLAGLAFVVVNFVHQTGTKITKIEKTANNLQSGDVLTQQLCGNPKFAQFIPPDNNICQ